MCVNVCRYSGEKLSLSNVAPLLYIPGLGLDSKKDYAQLKKRINKKYVWMFADVRVKNWLYSMLPLLHIPSLGLDSMKE